MSGSDWYADLELDRLFRLSLDFYCVVDIDGTLCQVSPSFMESLGYRADELLQRPLEDLLHPDDVDDTMAHLAHLREGEGVQRFQTRHKRLRGGWVWLFWTAGLDSTGRIYAIGRDVTSAVEVREALDERARALEATNEELRLVARVASHDLQEPLRSLASYSRILEDRYAQLLDEDGRQFLGFIAKAAERMLVRVRALSKYSHVGGRTVEPQALDVNQVVADVLKDIRTLIADAGVQVHVDPLPVLNADPALLPVVIHGLVMNSIKFRDGEAPQIWIGAERTPNGWRLAVADNGIGVQDRHRERIFDVFKQLHPQSRYGGTGIGLALCRRIVCQHGGVIRCGARKGGGTVFDFTIPSTEGRR